MSTLEELRARLESVEAARRDAQESRFALIVQNEELGADLAATRARLESTRAAGRELVKAARVITDDRYVDEWGKAQIDDDDLVALEDVLRRAEAEAGEESEG